VDTMLQRARGPQRRFEIKSKVWPSEVHSPAPDISLNWGFTPSQTRHRSTAGTSERGRQPLPYGTIDAATTGGTAATVTVVDAVPDRPALFVPVSVITCVAGFKVAVIEGPLPITPSSEDLHTSAEAGSDPS
jgi:hypothetical protein